MFFTLQCRSAKVSYIFLNGYLNGNQYILFNISPIVHFQLYPNASTEKEGI